MGNGNGTAYLINILKDVRMSSVLGAGAGYQGEGLSVERCDSLVDVMWERKVFAGGQAGEWVVSKELLFMSEWIEPDSA